MSSKELQADELRFVCRNCLFPFDTTAEVAPLNVMIGQERAVKAVAFALYTKNPEYNLFMSGLAGTGKITYAKAAVSEKAAVEPIPDDWCYVNNFQDKGRPLVISLPAGKGRALCQDMQEFLENLRVGISKLFKSEEYERARAEVIKKFQEQRTDLLDGFNQRVEQQGIIPQWTSTGFVGVPLHEGKPLGADDFQKLEKERRDEIERRMLTAHEGAMEVVRKVQLLERSFREQLKRLDGKIGMFAVGHLFDDIKAKYADYPEVAAYLDTVKQDIVKNISDFKPPASVEEDEDEEDPFAMLRKNLPELIREKYSVNLAVDNSGTTGAPVIVETNPTYYNLIGRVEYQTKMGVAITDFTMIKGGALHRANGGYLILNARDVLSNIGSWEALKRVLKVGKLHLENLGEQYGMISMASLKPQPIPIKVKVILVGPPYLYHLLYEYDEDFRKLFKVHADFEEEMANNEKNISKLAGFISSIVERENLHAFDRAAATKIVEYSSRLAASQKKLTTRFNELVDLLVESDVWAKVAGRTLVTVEDVKRAISEKRYRSNKYEEKMQEMFDEGKILIDTDGEAVGQVNGLAILSVGDYMFGKPSRITCNTFLGKGGVINIERETQMSGSTHSKGVFILTSYIGYKYAQKYPLTLAASLTFEQLYSGVEGDSASSTELYALMSSVAKLPIHQYIAVTGSVNQKGEIQPIGAVTEKIEGFFEVCRHRGLTGRQGVMIPHQNVDELTLSDDVVDAVAAGQFHIYPVRTVDEGIEILTGVPAGIPDENGDYLEKTVHGMVSNKLRENMEILLSLGKKMEGQREED